MIVPKLLLSSTILLTLSADDKMENALERAALAEAKLTLVEAMAACASYFHGGTVIKAEVDTENGIPSYVIDIKRNGRHRVLVDIRTGKLTITAPEADDLEKSRETRA
jgi:uncharacterized membrane protein YkoI